MSSRLIPTITIKPAAYAGTVVVVLG